MGWDAELTHDRGDAQPCTMCVLLQVDNVSPLPMTQQ